MINTSIELFCDFTWPWYELLNLVKLKCFIYSPYSWDWGIQKCNTQLQNVKFVFGNGYKTTPVVYKT